MCAGVNCNGGACMESNTGYMCECSDGTMQDGKPCPGPGNKIVNNIIKNQT